MGAASLVPCSSPVVISWRGAVSGGVSPPHVHQHHQQNSLPDVVLLKSTRSWKTHKQSHAVLGSNLHSSDRIEGSGSSFLGRSAPLLRQNTNRRRKKQSLPSSSKLDHSHQKTRAVLQHLVPQSPNSSPSLPPSNNPSCNRDCISPASSSLSKRRSSTFRAIAISDSLKDSAPSTSSSPPASSTSSPVAITVIPSSLLIALLVNYSVIVSDWWQFKHTAKDRFISYLAPLLSLASPILSPFLSLPASALSSYQLPSFRLFSTPGFLRRLAGRWLEEETSREEREHGSSAVVEESVQKGVTVKKGLIAVKEEVDVNADSFLWEQGLRDKEAEEMRSLSSPGFSFSAAGLLFPYHLGVTQCLLENGLITEDTPLAGSSAGALVCATVASGVDMKSALGFTKLLAEDCRANGTVFRLGLVLRNVLENILPEDAHLRCSGRIRVAVTQVFNSPRGLLIDQFDSRDDLINALITSSFVPGYLAPRPMTRFRDRMCIDGGISHFMPPTAAEKTIKVCAFPASALGLSDISISPDLDFCNKRSMRQLFTWALEPAESDMLELLFEEGKKHAQIWVEGEERWNAANLGGVPRVLSEQ